MADRRMGDRRAPEEGVIKLDTKKLVIVLIVSTVIIISVLINIILGIICSEYKSKYEFITNEMADDNLIESTTTSQEDNDYSCELSITGDKEQIKAGEAVVYEIGVENIFAETGITMYETLLDFDSDLFDCEVVEDEASEWSKTGFIENYLTMSRKDLMPSSENQKIFKLKVTAKAGIEAGEYSINLADSTFTMDENKSFSIPDDVILVRVVNN